MVGNVNYVDVINEIGRRGWTIVSQSPDATQVEIQVGAPRIPAIALSFIPVLGMFLAVLWIYQRGTASITIERHRNTAHVVTRSNAYDIKRNEDLETFFTSHDFSGNVGYYPVLITGALVSFALFFLGQIVI